MAQAPRNPLANRLIDSKLVSELQINQALEVQRKKGGFIGEILVKLGYLSEDQLLTLLSKEFGAMHMSADKLGRMKIPPSVLDMLPAKLARKHGILPLQYREKDKTLFIAVGDPQNQALLDNLKKVVKADNLKLVVCMSDAIRETILRMYGPPSETNIDLGKAGIDDSLDFDDHAELDGEVPGIDSGGTGAIDPAQVSSDDSSYGMHREDAIDMGLPDEEDEFMEIDHGGSMIGHQSTPIVEEDEPEETPEFETGEIDLGAPDPMSSTLDEDGAIDIGLDLTAPEESEDDSAVTAPLEEDLVSEDMEHEMLVSTAPTKPAEPEATADEEPHVLEEEHESESVKRVREEESRRRRVLLVERHAKVARFIQRLLESERYEVTVVSQPGQVEALLEKKEFDDIVVQEKVAGYGMEFESMVMRLAPEANLSIIGNYGAAITGRTRAVQRLNSCMTESFDVLIGLLELGKGGFRGHTHVVTKYCKLVARKLMLDESAYDGVSIASSLHDLGIEPGRHRTLISLSEEDEDPTEIPLKVLSSVKFPYHVKEIILHRFERWDGKGRPDGQQGEEIPIGSRILAVIDAYQELITDRGDGLKKSQNEAMEQILAGSGKLFDPRVVDTFLQVIQDELKLGRLEGPQERVVVVDPDSESNTLIGLKFTNEGFRVDSYTEGEEGLAAIRGSDTHLVILETEIPGKSGLEICEELRTGTNTIVPIVFYSKVDRSDVVTKAFELGAEDYIAKPEKMEILFAKVNRILSRLRAQRGERADSEGVSGNLKEMSLPDIIQILSAGRKTGVIQIERDGEDAQIYIEDGRIVNCVYGELKGEEAIYQVVIWGEGAFTINANAEIQERLIDKSNDSLILEAFRRYDEQGREGDGGEEEIKLDGSDFF